MWLPQSKRTGPDSLTRWTELSSAVGVTFLLTTDRANLLEPALASRPGGSTSPPSSRCPTPRRRLIQLYRGDLVLELTREDVLIERTEGVTAAFLKELLHKAALLACEADEAGEEPTAGSPPSGSRS